MSTEYEVVKSLRHKLEPLTPHKLTVAVLVKSFCHFRIAGDFSTIEVGPLKAKYRRDFCVLILKLLQTPDLTLTELRSIMANYTLHEQVLDLFEQNLQEMCTNGTGALLDLLDSLTQIININDSTTSLIDLQNYVSKSCVLGYFIRKLIVIFDKLTFSEVTGVHLKFQKYYQEWRKTTANPIKEEVKNRTLLTNWSANSDQWSRKQAELFIVTQAQLLTINEEKALQPAELQNKITELLKSNPALSEAHFLSYLNYLRVKEFCGAIDSLYHSFDRSVPLDSTTGEDKSRIYRYAAINLAILHSHFGHKESARSALNEAIKIAHAANDNICLQHALAWLHRLSVTNRETYIEHLISKSYDLSLSYSTSLSIQSIAHHACLLGVDPHIIFETLVKSDGLNYQHSLRSLLSNSKALKAALWSFYGKPEMCSLWSQLLFYLNIDVYNTNKAFYCEGFILAVCNVANYLLLQGNYALVNTVLNFLKERFPSEPNCHYWMFSENIFVFTRSLYHENWTEAEQAAQKLLLLDKWEGYLRLAELYSLKQDYIESHRILDALMTKYNSDQKYRVKTHYYIRAKILLAEVQFASSFPDRVPPGMMTLLSSCLVEAQKYRMDYYVSLIHLHIANLQLCLGLTSQSLKLLDRCMVQILTHGGNFDRARANLLYVKCMVAHSNQMEQKERHTVIFDCAKMLDKVKDDFRSVEAYSRVKDAVFLQAHLYDNISMKSERNKCALEFRLLEEERATKNYYTLVNYL